MAEPVSRSLTTEYADTVPALKRRIERLEAELERVQTARREALEEALITIMAAADGGEKAILDAARALLDKEPS